jgi:hypothetical protein
MSAAWKDERATTYLPSGVLEEPAVIDWEIQKIYEALRMMALPGPYSIPSAVLLLLLRLQQLVALLEHAEDGLRRTGVQTEPAALKAT